MKYLIAILLSAAGLVASAPLDSDAATKQLSRRFKPTSNCGLDMYPTATQSPVKNGIKYLKGEEHDKPPKAIFSDFGQQGQLISCSYGTGIFLSVDDVDGIGKALFNPKDLGQQVEDVYV